MMDLERKNFATVPEHLIAGVRIGVITSVKTAAEDLKKGAVVLLNGDGQVTAVTASTENETTTVSTEGLYGIVADDALSGEDAVIYLTGEFFAAGLTLEEDVTAEALEVPLRNLGIFLKY